MGVAMKRKADEILASPWAEKRVKAPYYENGATFDMDASPLQAVHWQSRLEADHGANSNATSECLRSGVNMDVEMGSPGQMYHRSPIQGILSAQRIWRSICSDDSSTGRRAKREVCKLAWTEYLNDAAQPLAPGLVPREQYEAAQDEVQRLKGDLAALNFELAEAKIKISQMETQQSSYQPRRPSGAALATSFQQNQRQPPSWQPQVSVQPQRAVLATPFQYISLP